jgi:hypothetical protein
LVLASEIAEERSRKTMLEARGSTIATTAATLAASAIALGGLLYSSDFSFATTRILFLTAIIGSFSIAVVLALLALSVRNYPNIPGADIRAAKESSDWSGEAFAIDVFVLD